MSAPALRNTNPGVWLSIGVCVLAALMIKPVQDRIQNRMDERGAEPDILYFAGPAVVRKLALGYESLLADIYWMRAIQYYGRREEADRRPVRYKNLPAMLDITSTLDPGMIDVYRAGSLFLAEPEPAGAGLPGEAVRLLDKGIRGHPHDWRLYLDKGFIYFWFLKDYRQAGETWLAGGRLGASPPWLPGLAAMALSKGGEIETAKLLWRQQLEQAARAEVRDNARNHLISIQVAETIWTLEFFVEQYKQKSGRFPADLQALVGAGYLRLVPEDPSGVPYKYEPSTGYVALNPDSKVRFLQVPAEYRDSYRLKLAQLYGAR